MLPINILLGLYYLYIFIPIYIPMYNIIYKMFYQDYITYNLKSPKLFVLKKTKTILKGRRRRLVLCFNLYLHYVWVKLCTVGAILRLTTIACLLWALRIQGEGKHAHTPSPIPVIWLHSFLDRVEDCNGTQGHWPVEGSMPQACRWHGWKPWDTHHFFKCTQTAHSFQSGRERPAVQESRKAMITCTANTWWRTVKPALRVWQQGTTPGPTSAGSIPGPGH